MEPEDIYVLDRSLYENSQLNGGQHLTNYTTTENCTDTNLDSLQTSPTMDDKKLFIECSSIYRRQYTDMIGMPKTSPVTGKEEGILLSDFEALFKWKTLDTPTNTSCSKKEKKTKQILDHNSHSVTLQQPQGDG